jgi:hypothetical protein
LCKGEFCGAPAFARQLWMAHFPFKEGARVDLVIDVCERLRGGVSVRLGSGGFGGDGWVDVSDRSWNHFRRLPSLSIFQSSTGNRNFYR